MEELTRYQKYYRANREKVKKKTQDYRDRNRNEVNRKVREALRLKRIDPEFRKKDAERVKAYRLRIRAKVFDYYGGKCACCGESTNEFLSIDHINRDGRRHRLQIGRSFYTWIKNHNFPDDLRILCHNCNFSSGRMGICAHKNSAVHNVEDNDFNTISKRVKVARNARKYRRNLRMKVLNHYGAHCACCGEDIVDFLCLDHVNGGGTKHRKSLGGTSTSVYAWVKKQGFPDDFRVLCHNCNQSLGLYGFCPHQQANE